MVAKVLGVSTTSTKLEGGMLLGIHSDYLRILFVCGYAGLACYLMFYLALFLVTVEVVPERPIVSLSGGPLPSCCCTP